MARAEWPPGFGRPPRRLVEIAQDRRVTLSPACHAHPSSLRLPGRRAGRQTRGRHPSSRRPRCRWCGRAALTDTDARRRKPPHTLTRTHAHLHVANRTSDGVSEAVWVASPTALPRPDPARPVAPAGMSLRQRPAAAAPAAVPAAERTAATLSPTAASVTGPQRDRLTSPRSSSRATTPSSDRSPSPRCPPSDKGDRTADTGGTADKRVRR